MDRSARTAISRRLPSAPARRLVALLPPAASVLDYGCGRGMDTDWLSALGFAAHGWDPNHRPDPAPLDGRYDVVMCNYVLNVLEPEARAEAFRAACALAPTAYFTVRCDADSVTGRWVAHGDGWLTPTGTFQRFFTREGIPTEFPGATVVSADSSGITFRIGPDLAPDAIAAAA